MVQPTAAVPRHPAWLDPACHPPPVPLWAPDGLMLADRSHQGLPMAWCSPLGAAWGCLSPGGVPFTPSMAGISSLLPDPFGGSYLDSSLAESSWTCCGMQQSQFSPKSPCRVWGRNKLVQE